MEINHWDYRFLRIAAEVASWSKDPSTKCGSVIVRPNRTIAAVGFNGFPRGCDDSPELYSNRELKYARVVHAEVNAIVSCQERPEGYTMYNYPWGIGPSCDRCTAVIIQSGIRRVVHVYKQPEPGDFHDRWRETIERGLQMYKEAGVEVVPVPFELWADET